MKVLFIMKYPLIDNYALKNKFDGQMKAMTDLGNDVYYVAYDHMYTYLIHNENKITVKKIWFGNTKQYIHIKAFYDLYDSVNRILNKLKFDVAYIRDAPLPRIGAKMCRKLKATGCKIVVEIPTFPPESEAMPTFTKKMYMRYSRLCWTTIRDTISLYVLIGKKANEYNGIPAINIDNGVNVDAFSIRQPVFSPDKIQLLAVASMSKWQGYDRLIKGIAALSPEKKQLIELHMVGPEGDGSLGEWKRLADSLNLNDIIIFDGMKMGEELDPYFNKADLGICTLGLYRKGFESGSILKLREYTARGLPFVYAADDPALPKGQFFCLRVSNDDTMLDLDKIIAFAYKMRNETHIPDKMRQYAKDYMSWDAQMEYVYNKMKTI